jgi:hypothetical protein
MPDITVSANVNTLMQAANFSAFRTSLGLGALSTVTAGTGIATALAINVGSAGAPVLFNGAGGTPTSIVLTNATGTAASLTAGTASAVAVGGITGLGTGVATMLATFSSANIATACTDETGSGVLVFGTSPAFTTSVTTGSTTFALLNTTATTVNAFGAATALNIGAAAATVLNFGGHTSAAELRFLEPSGSGTNYTGLKQPALATSITYLWPSDAPANGDVLTCQTDGTLSWETPSGAANAVTAASTAAGSGLFWVSGGADRSATATDTVDAINTTDLAATTLVLGGTTVTATGTELNFVDGVTSAIQTQLNAKANLAGGNTFTGAQVFPSGQALIAPVLGTPTSGTLTNCTGLPASGIAAGVLGGNITLGESTGQIILDPTLSADGTWSGIMQAGTAGATLAFGDLIYLAAADSRWELADADAAATSGDVVLGMCVLAAAADGDPTNVLLYGKIRADAAFPALTIGAPAYAGTTAGDIQVAQPSATDDVIRVVGYALTADVLLFNPAGFYITHT